MCLDQRVPIGPLRAKQEVRYALRMLAIKAGFSRGLLWVHFAPTVAEEDDDVPKPPGGTFELPFEVFVKNAPPEPRRPPEATVSKAAPPSAGGDAPAAPASAPPAAAAVPAAAAPMSGAAATTTGAKAAIGTPCAPPRPASFCGEGTPVSAARATTTELAISETDESSEEDDSAWR